MTPRPIVIIAGPTASGKSHTALAIAKKYGGVIINADAMQVYEEIPILSAQPTLAEQEGIPHYLYGVLPGSEACSAAKWVSLAVPIITKAQTEGLLPIVVGGTGLYIKSLTKGLSAIPDIAPDVRISTREQMQTIGKEKFYEELKYVDPVMASRLRPTDTQRLIRAMEVWKQTGISLSVWQEKKPLPPLPDAQFITFFMHPDRTWLYERCNSRFLQMMHQGGLEEATALLAKRYPESLPVMKALGVPSLLTYLKEEMPLEEAISHAQQATRNYAKRQVTWFKHQLHAAEEITYNNLPSATEKALTSLSFLSSH